jgi:RHS repeat-associated protein
VHRQSASGSTCSSGTTYATGYGYNAAQELTGFNYGNGVAATFGYSNDRLQLTSLNYKKGASTLFGLAYSYGAAGSNNGQIQSITDSVDNERSATYTYDTLARLSTAVTTGSANYPAWGLQQSYDRYGNRWSQTAISGCTGGITCPQPSVAVSATTNRITGSPYAYDANGNMTNDGINTLVYDAENHAVSSSSGAYTYDGNNLRVKKCLPNCSSPTTTTVYLFSGSKVLAEYDNGAAPTAPSREYIYSGAALLAKIDSSGTKYYHQDHLSNRLVTDSTGTTSAQLGHFPFGESWYNAANDKLRFTSYERDAESGNDYALARYHISRLGRFSSPDPLAGSVGDPQSLNRYTYVRNSPTNYIDPYGLNVANPGYCDAFYASCGGGGDGPVYLLDGWLPIDAGSLAACGTRADIS